MNNPILNTLTAATLVLAITACGDDGGNSQSTSSESTGASSTGIASGGVESTGSQPTSTSGTSTTDNPSDGTSSSGDAPVGPRGAPPALAAQIDRAGRAAISTATIETFQTDARIVATEKDAYNAASPDAWADYIPQMMASLAILDALDATCGNQLLADAGDQRYAFLAGVLSDDRLWVNSDSGTCGVYLGVEAEAIGAVPEGAGGCGGRSPADDVIERSYSVLAAGILDGIDDGVTEDDGAVTDSFPFLGAPE